MSATVFQFPDRRKHVCAERSGLPDANARKLRGICVHCFAWRPNVTVLGACGGSVPLGQWCDDCLPAFRELAQWAKRMAPS